MSPRITIVGAGNLGVACAAHIAAKGIRVTLFTGNPSGWSNDVAIEDFRNCRIEGRLASVTSDPKCAAEADLILLCVPGNALEGKLTILRPYLNNKVPIASICSGDGFFFVSEKLLGADWPAMGFQRVPFICRMTDNSHTVRITGYKDKIFLAYRNVSSIEDWRLFFEEVFNTRTFLLKNFYEAAFVNGNVVLHPARLMSLQRRIGVDGPFLRVPLFYEEWDNEASEWAIRLDDELRNVAKVFGVYIQPFLEYYESTGVSSLTDKIRSIAAFRGILSPMTEGGVIDLKSRYVLSDIGIALKNIARIGFDKGIPCPAADAILGCFA